MSEFDLYGGEERRKKERRNGIAMAVGLALAACFVLGVILCMGLLVGTVVDQATDANKSLSQGATSIQGIEKTAKDFLDYSKKALAHLQISTDQMAKDLNEIAQKIDNLTSSVTESP